MLGEMYITITHEVCDFRKFEIRFSQDHEKNIYTFAVNEVKVKFCVFKSRVYPM